MEDGGWRMEDGGRRRRCTILYTPSTPPQSPATPLQLSIMTQLHLELHGPSSYLSTPWAFGVSLSHASLLLRKAIQRCVLLGREKLGFRHIRFHGVFVYDMKMLQPDGSYDF